MAAVAAGADSAVAGEGTGAKSAIYGQQFLYKNCSNSPQTASPYRKPIIRKTQLNVEMSLLVVKSAKIKRVRWREDPRSSLLKKQRAWIKEYE